MLPSASWIRGSNCAPTDFDGLDVETAEGVVHLFDDELDAGAKLV